MKNYLPYILALVLGVVIGYFLFGGKPKIETKIETKTDTTYIEHHDTVPDTKIVKEKVLKYVYVGGDTIYDTDTIRVRDSIPIPITQKEYQDTSYHAWVSGYLPSLDSIYVRERVVTNTINTTNTLYKKWNIGVQGGYGYGIKSKTFEPYVGFGIQYNLK